MSVFFCCNHETLIPFLYLFDLKLLIDIIIIYIYIYNDNMDTDGLVDLN